MRTCCFALIAVIAVIAAAVLAGCNKPDDGRYVTDAKGGVAEVAWADVHMEFEKLAQPKSLTFVELAGVHCGGCKKNMKLFKQLAEVRPDISFRVVMFPEELCADPKSPECRQAGREANAGGGCYTPAIYAFDPDGKLLAKDDTCRDSRPASELFHALADKELKKS